MKIFVGHLNISYVNGSEQKELIIRGTPGIRGTEFARAVAETNLPPANTIKQIKSGRLDHSRTDGYRKAADHSIAEGYRNPGEHSEWVQFDYTAAVGPEFFEIIVDVGTSVSTGVFAAWLYDFIQEQTDTIGHGNVTIIQVNNYQIGFTRFEAYTLNHEVDIDTEERNTPITVEDLDGLDSEDVVGGIQISKEEFQEILENNYEDDQ